MASEAAGKEAVAVMTQLNKKAREILDKFTIHACTDVTGFGLLGHCGEMASASRAKIELWPKDIAYIEGAKEYAQMGLIPGEHIATEIMSHSFLKREIPMRCM